MKKLLFLTLLLLSSLALNAQRCVVLDFQIGTNVTEEEVKAVSYEFRSNFNPSCYTVEDYFRVKRIMKEMDYDVSNMKKEQIRDFGRDMIATIVVYGSLSKFMDEYSLDILVMDISSGTTVSGKSTTFQKSEYREKTPIISKEIALKLCNTKNQQSNSNNGSSSVVNSISTQNSIPKDYTDLGLPSGTLWKNYNETGFYSYNEAIDKFNEKNIPTWNQWTELKSKCQWTWTGSGYKVTGPNGNSITIPAAGDPKGSKGEYGWYWSSTEKKESEYEICGRIISSEFIGLYMMEIYESHSVRLVQNK